MMLVPRGYRYWIDHSILSLWGCILFSGTGIAQSDSYERPPIDYLNKEVHDPVAILAKRIASDEVKLEYDRQSGYLKSILKELDVPVSSQVLVFSKTSLQLQKISPRHPRALYFNDEVYVGWCFRGDVVELAATDPEQGAIFYTLKQDANDGNRLIRDRGQCLTCHASSRTQGVPGYLVRSVSPDKAGFPILGSGTFTTDHKSPFEQRWGGWYVTGTHGQMQHMGNQIYTEDQIQTELRQGQNLKNLDDFFTTDAYLSSHSDLVALMVLEHQTQMHNAITAASFETRQALYQSFEMNELLDRGAGYVSESATRRIDAVAKEVVSHLLMSDEYALRDEVSGTSDFAKDFEARGIKDKHGRSLRELDLKKKLFKYSCSYLIYTSAFKNLPLHVRENVIARLLDVLQGRDTSNDFSHLDKITRDAILEILIDTHPLIREAYRKRMGEANAAS